ncbi:MAG: tetratricopeptide repeat protein [Balneolaceae bacterium]
MMMKRITLTLCIFIGFATLTYGQSEQEPPYGMGELEAYSVFVDAYQSEDYELARTYGEWMINARPETIEGHPSFDLERQFERMTTIYANLAQDESDPTVADEYLQSALNTFDIAFETFTSEEQQFEWNQLKGRFYQSYMDMFDDGLEKTIEYYTNAFELDPEKFTGLNDGYFAEILLTSYISADQQEEALAMIEEIEQYASPALQSEIDDARNELFDNPEERVVFLESQLEEADEEEREGLIAEMVDLYDELDDEENSTKWAEELYDLNPNYENTQRIADIYLSAGQYEEALDYLLEAKEESPSVEEEKVATLEIAETYQQLDDLESARDYAQEAMDLDSDWGEPYLRISSIYAAAISDCTSNRDIERDDRTVYWLVVDYLEEGISVDSSIESVAQERINSYEPVMPTSEDKFFREWEDGQTINIDASIGECYGWINETTSVR